MHTLIRMVGVRQAVSREAPSLVPSIFIAEAFYKFHSFTLECAAFLATWYALSYVTTLARAGWQGHGSAQATISQ
jgi:hypothetical protein